MRFISAIALLFIIRVLPAQIISNDSFHQVNSLFDELNPVISADGKTLFFTLGNHPGNMGGKKDSGDIWISQWMGDQWSAPIHGGDVLNDRAYNGVAGVSMDGKYLFLLSHYNASGNSAKTQGISISKNSGSGWSEPENIFIPYFQNRSSQLCGAISADQSIFIFSAETYGSYGVDDLYVSIKENGKWSEPRNLGSIINTQFQELSPSLSQDGKTLFFSSNGRKGIGSFDVYSSTRLDDSWTNWSAPVNLGATINSEGRELYYRDFPQLGFSMYSTTKNSDGYGDIKMHRYNEPVIKKENLSVVQTKTSMDTAIKIVERPVSGNNTKVVKVYGKIASSKTGEPVTAHILFAAPQLKNENGTVSSAIGYSVEIPASDVYTIKIEAAGYVSTLEKLDIHTYEMQELEMNFNLQPVEIGTTVNLKSVLFVQTKTTLLPESYDELDMVVSFLKTNPNVKIDLSGHTDNRGVHADNVKLSQQRVNTVKSYLVSKGVEGKRITGKGYGGTKPISNNDTEETRKMNRRVEFTIKKF